MLYPTSPHQERKGKFNKDLGRAPYEVHYGTIHLKGQNFYTQVKVAINLAYTCKPHFCPPRSTMETANDSASKIMQISSQLTFFSKESIKATQETKHNHCKILMQYAYVQH